MVSSAAPKVLELRGYRHAAELLHRGGWNLHCYFSFQAETQLTLTKLRSPKQMVPMLFLYEQPLAK